MAKTILMMQNSMFPPKTGDKIRFSTHTTSFQHSTARPRQYNKGRCKSVKKAVKISLFTVDMIAYIENPKESQCPPPKRLLGIISEFSKVVRHKVNIKKLDVFLYFNNKQKMKFNKATLLLHINIKYLEINLTNMFKTFTFKNTYISERN